MKRSDWRIKASQLRQMKLMKRSNTFLYSFMIIFVFGYLFFFTSSLWMPATYTGVDITPIGKTVNAGERAITVDSWNYCPEQKKMEIMIEIENNSIDGIDRYEWQIKTRRGALKIKPILQESDFVVLFAEGVPSDWNECSLTMNAPRRFLNYAKDFEPVQIYVNDSIVTQVDRISQKSQQEYRLQAYRSRTEAYKNQIRLLRQKTASAERKMKKADQKIREIQEKMQYQTDQEKLESSNLIDELLAKKESESESKEAYESQIKELQEKIRLQGEQIRSLQGNPDSGASDQKKGQEVHEE